MKYDIVCTATVEGDPAAIWEARTDLPAYPGWDGREEELRLDGPFGPGATGFSKQVGRRPGSSFVVTAVEPRTRFTTQCPLPGGKLVLDHRMSDTATGEVKLCKTYRVHGPLSVLFRVYFGREIRRNMPSTFAALAAEAARRTAERRA